MNFSGAANGSSPQGSLITDGTFLYGMTYDGGVNDLGTIFKIKPDKTGYSKLLEFDGFNNGSNPYGSLYFDGTFLYGMTSTGGINDSGTIFKIKPDGTSYSKLLDFSGSVNGSDPRGSLISDGTFLYGTTYRGGVKDSGTVFKIKPDGSQYAKLMDCSGAVNGSYPRGSLIFAGGFLYGMTYQGGNNTFGTIFKIQPDGTNYSKLLDFSGIANGSYPIGSLLSDGTFLYGMTYQGAANNLGALFRIKPDGSNYSNLLDFSGAANGSNPFGSLMSDGIFLYGMTYNGGANDEGAIFQIKPDGTSYLKLWDFSGVSSGIYPTGSLISDGSFFYGMTSGGGTGALGTIFSFQAPSYIANVTVTSYTVCTGSNTSLSFSTGGTFNTGNIFTAQLSNASGNFSSPVTIGSFNSVSSGVIPCVIPAKTPAGSGYRVRVVSTDPVITSNDNGTDISINLSPSITTTTPALRCDAGKVTLNATASSGLLDWYSVPSGGTSLGTGTSFTTPTLSLTTTYYVSVTDNGCISARTAVTATVVVVTSTTPASRCGQGTLTLSAASSSGILNWYNTLSGGTLLGAGTSFLTPVINANTTYYVDATDGCTTSRLPVTATVNPLPVIITSGNTTICTGSSSILTASGGTTYLWLPGGETTTSILVSPTSNTSYTVQVSDINSCSDVSTVSVTVDPCTGISGFYLERSVKVFPNPVSTSATFVINGMDIGINAEMILFDVFGKEIKRLKVEANTFEINRDNLPAGIYNYRLNDVKGIFASGKLIVE